MKWLVSLAVLGLGSGLACGYIPQTLLALTHQQARQAGLDRHLLAALVWHESRFCPAARSPRGALGLGQLMPATARMYRVNPLDPAQNLYATARYLRHLYQQLGRWDWALAAYNAGPTAVRRHRGVPPYHETRAFVRKVLHTYAQFAQPR